MESRLLVVGVKMQWPALQLPASCVLLVPSAPWCCGNAVGESELLLQGSFLLMAQIFVQ